MVTLCSVQSPSQNKVGRGERYVFRKIPQMFVVSSPPLPLTSAGEILMVISKYKSRSYPQSFD